MSYCVHCGVELDKTASRCALCNTPVFDPNQAVDYQSPPPFPTNRGQVEQVKHTDVAILLSVVFGSTAFACGMLNLLLFKGSLWSFYIIGVCLMFWVFSTPALLYTKLPIYISIIFDGFVVGIYCFLISTQIPGNGWFEGLAVPIIAILTLLLLVFVFLIRMLRVSILSSAIYCFTELAIFCVCLELLIHNYIESRLYLTWAAVVLVSCIFIDAVLLTIITRSRLRDAVRRSMHI